MREDLYVRVSVKDKGAGIPQELLDRIFDPYFSTKAYNKGMGLGLSICHSIIHKHGGHMAVASRENMGTDIFFICPLPTLQTDQEHPRGGHFSGPAGMRTFAPIEISCTHFIADSPFSGPTAWRIPDHRR